ncbi:MAG TPA: 1-deoxy-D-xylulose-5-phosphate reductoisomerase, partial [Aeromicrobium sp.]|nr:1-deoxy-D-xylulose-5-phosphate reductoisomerase [Aeromicrobium sp.]
RTAPAVLNAANEVCVEAFIAERLPFLSIVDTVSAVVSEHIQDPGVRSNELTVESVLAADVWARKRATEITAKGSR